MKKFISIIMTVYNQERYLAPAIKSVLIQTRPDFELLIWDDGSTDRSVEIARHFAQIDPLPLRKSLSFLKSFPSPKHIGI